MSTRPTTEDPNIFACSVAVPFRSTEELIGTMPIIHPNYFPNLAGCAWAGRSRYGKLASPIVNYCIYSLLTSIKCTIKSPRIQKPQRIRKQVINPQNLVLEGIRIPTRVAHRRSTFRVMCLVQHPVTLRWGPCTLVMFWVWNCCQDTAGNLANVTDLAKRTPYLVSFEDWHTSPEISPKNQKNEHFWQMVTYVFHHILAVLVGRGRNHWMAQWWGRNKRRALVPSSSSSFTRRRFGQLYPITTTEIQARHILVKE